VAILDDPPRHARWRGRAAPRRPDAADAVGELCSPSPSAGRCRPRMPCAARAGGAGDRARRAAVRPPNQTERWTSSRSSGDIARRVGVKAERNAPLAKLTTMRVGGPADLLATAHNTFELRALVRFARSAGCR
jgi:hypothetical protein